MDLSFKSCSELGKLISWSVIYGFSFSLKAGIMCSAVITFRSGFAISFYKTH